MQDTVQTLAIAAGKSVRISTKTTKKSRLRYLLPLLAATAVGVRGTGRGGDANGGCCQMSSFG